MTLKDVVVKVLLKREDASFDQVKKELQKIEKDVKIKTELLNVNGTISDLNAVKNKMLEIKKTKEDIAKITLSDGRDAFINRFGKMSLNRGELELQTSIRKDELAKIREQRKLNAERHSNINKEKALVQKMSYTGEIMRGALMTMGYQVVSLLQRGASEIIDASNKVLKIQSQMATLTNDKLSQRVFEKDVYSIAKSSYTDVNDVSDLYTKIGQNAKYLGYGGQDISKMTQAVFDAFSVGGVGLAQQKGAITQLTQTITKGKHAALWSDIKFLEEDAPELANMIAEGLGLQGGMGALKQAIAEGKITGKAIGDALIKESQKEREKFLKSNKLRIEQAGSYFRTRFMEAMSQNTESFSKIAKSLVKLTDKLFDKDKGLFTRVVNGIANIADKADGWIDKFGHFLNICGEIYDALGGIEGIFTKGAILYGVMKIGSAISALYVNTGHFFKDITTAVTLLSKKLIVVTAIVVGILLLLAAIQDFYTGWMDADAETSIFGRIAKKCREIYETIKSIVDFIHSDESAGMFNVGIKREDNSVLSRIQAMLPSFGHGDASFAVNFNQTINGNVDSQTAEMMADVGKQNARDISNRETDLYMAKYMS